MRKTLLLLVCLCACVSVSAKSRFGLTAGITTSRLVLEEEGIKSSTVFAGGLVFKQPLALGFVIQPELLFNTKGVNRENELFNDNIRVSYLELPVQLQWGVDLIALRPYIFAEPFIGYALAGKYNDKNDPQGGLSDMSGAKSRFEYGIGAGAGIEVGDRIQLSAKYYWNLEDFDYYDETYGWIYHDYKDCRGARGFSVMLTFLF